MSAALDEARRALAAATRDSRAARKAAGLCSSCTALAEPGGTKCAHHAAAARATSREYAVATARAVKKWRALVAAVESGRDLAEVYAELTGEVTP